MQAEQIDELVVGSEDHRKYAVNVHKRILELDHEEEVAHPHHKHHSKPPKTCCEICWHRSVKIKLATILIFDIVIYHFWQKCFMRYYTAILTDIYRTGTVVVLIAYFSLFRSFFLSSTSVCGIPLLTLRKTDSENVITFDERGDGGNGQLVILDYDETTPGYVHPHTTEEFTDDEIEKLRYLSKIAASTKDLVQDIEYFCGDTYYEDYLIGKRHLETESQCQWMLKYGQIIEVIYLAFDFIYLALMGLADKSTGGKVMLIIFWMLQAPPFLMYFHFLLLFNSYRFCIINYSYSFRPQLSGTVYILCIVIFYKLLFLFRASTAYVIDLVHGKLFLSFNEFENNFTDMPGPAYHKFFSEKEGQDVKQQLLTEPGTFRLIVNELPFGTANPPTGNVLTSSRVTSLTSITETSYRGTSNFTSVSGLPSEFNSFLKK